VSLYKPVMLSLKTVPCLEAASRQFFSSLGLGLGSESLGLGLGTYRLVNKSRL
jgi:hypothetical protein